jgi:hypothetical protein
MFPRIWIATRQDLLEAELRIPLEKILDASAAKRTAERERPMGLIIHQSDPHENRKRKALRKVADKVAK